MVTACGSGIYVYLLAPRRETRVTLSIVIGKKSADIIYARLPFIRTIGEIVENEKILIKDHLEPRYAVNYSNASRYNYDLMFSLRDNGLR